MKGKIHIAFIFLNGGLAALILYVNNLLWNLGDPSAWIASGVNIAAVVINGIALYKINQEKKGNE